MHHKIFQIEKKVLNSVLRGSSLKQYIIKNLLFFSQQAQRKLR